MREKRLVRQTLVQLQVVRMIDQIFRHLNKFDELKRNIAVYGVQMHLLEEQIYLHVYSINWAT